MSPYLLRLCIRDNDALLEKYKAHGTYEGDSGVDLFLPDDAEFRPWGSLCIDHQVRAEMIDTRTGRPVSYYLYPRSSLAKTPLRLNNSVGVIDSGYRGPLRAFFTALPVESFFEGENIYRVPRHSRLVQICSPTLEPVRVEFVTSLSDTARGQQGFGSSGGLTD